MSKPYGPIPTELIPVLGIHAAGGCLLQFTVSGKGRFPMDMLRYDGACADAPVDASTELRDIRVLGERCTPERWRSFGWSVHNTVTEVAE